MARTLFKSKKAISPILATLLLIVIAVAAIVVTYAWIMTYMNNANQQAGVMLSLTNARFYTQGTTKKIDIDVINSGTADTQIIKVYAGPQGNLVQQTTSPTTPVPLTHNNVATITMSYNWTASATIYFTVVPSPGAALTEIPEQAPAS